MIHKPCIPCRSMGTEHLGNPHLSSAHCNCEGSSCFIFTVISCCSAYLSAPLNPSIKEFYSLDEPHLLPFDLSTVFSISPRHLLIGMSNGGSRTQNLGSWMSQNCLISFCSRAAFLLSCLVPHYPILSCDLAWPSIYSCSHGFGTPEC